MVVKANGQEEGGNNDKRMGAAESAGSAYKENYPHGTRIMLINMEDPWAPVPSGTREAVLLFICPDRRINSKALYSLYFRKEK